MNSMKIPGQQTLDLKRSVSITSDSHRNKLLNSKKILYDIRRICSKESPTNTCLSTWIIHIHVVTSHYNRLGLFKIHHRELSISFSVILKSMFAQIFPQQFFLININIYMFKVHSLHSVSQHQFHTNSS